MSIARRNRREVMEIANLDIGALGVVTREEVVSASCTHVLAFLSSSSAANWTECLLEVFIRENELGWWTKVMRLRAALNPNFKVCKPVALDSFDT